MNGVSTPEATYSPISLQEAALLVANEDRRGGLETQAPLWNTRECSTTPPQTPNSVRWSTASSGTTAQSFPFENWENFSVRKLSGGTSIVSFQRGSTVSNESMPQYDQAQTSSASLHSESVIERIQTSDDSPDASPEDVYNNSLIRAFQYQPPPEACGNRKVICNGVIVNPRKQTTLETEVCICYPKNFEETQPWVTRTRVMTNFSARRRALNLSYLANEKDIHGQLSHRNIARFLGCSSASDDMKLILIVYTEYSGRDPCKVTEELPDNTRGSHIRNWTKQIINGVCYLHRNNILHRDIKPENMAIDSHGQLRLFDLGLAKNIENEHPTDSSGTSVYMSPEARKKQPQGKKSDLYSLGQTVLRVCVQANILTVDYPRKKGFALPTVRFHKKEDKLLDHWRLRRVIDGVNLVKPEKREPLVMLHFILNMPNIESIKQNGPPVSAKELEPLGDVLN